MRVLVVDDDDASRYLVSSLVRGHGLDVVEARDGKEALEAARTAPVDLVVTDILMPVMDGYALARAWKADPALAAVPLVFYTASYTEPADRAFAESLGVDGFFVKPQEPETLMGIITDALDAGSKATPHAATERNESEVLREYSERLVSKLEQKVVEVNKANDDLRHALEVLSDEVEVKKTLIEKLNTDLAMREQAEHDLRAASETLAVIVRSSPVAIAALDLDRRVTVWNPATERLLGWTEAEAVGHVYPPIAGDAEAARLFDEQHGPLLSGEKDAAQAEVRRKRKDGSLVDLAVNVAPIRGEDGRVTGILSVFEDVTERRHVETLKSDFVSMVSHELRTPLTSIIGYSDLLEQIDMTKKPELFHQLLGKIRDRGDRMRRLIDDLLSVSQVQSGPLRLELEETDVAQFVRSALDRAEIVPPHTLVFDAVGGLPHAMIDRERIRGVIAHLVGNAVKYAPDGGDVLVSVNGEEGAIRIDVTDQGVGIEPPDLEHVFDRFTQADMSDTRSFGGVGLGLFLAKQTVEAHGGTIAVASVPGEGSTFTVRLPVAT